MADVKLRQVVKRFGDIEIIHGVDLDINDNEFTVFVGPSGCGKSTLLRLIAGLEDISDGTMTIDGEVVNDLPPAQRGIAMVFQSYALYPHMSVFDNMAFGLKLAKYGKDAVAERVNKAAEILQITRLLDRKPRELSGGQRQRVAIGRAIVREPKVFLFDEPLSNLDAALRVQMRIELANLKRELNATMVYVTHDQVEAMTLADKIVVLRDGYVEQVGSPLELYHYPRNLFVGGFIGSPRMNFVECTVTGVSDASVTVAIPGGGSVAVPCKPGNARIGNHVTLGIRPEHMFESGGGDTEVQGNVFVVERLGGESYLYVRLDKDAEITVQADGNSPAKVSDTITVGIDAAACHLFDSDGMAFERTRARETAPA